MAAKILRITPYDVEKNLYAVSDPNLSVGGGPIFPPEPPDPNPPHPAHPIVLPGDPSWGPPYPTPTPPGPGRVIQATVVVAGPNSPIPDTPPEGVQLTKATISFGPGTKPAAAWIGPYVSTGPIDPPAVSAPTP